jgi:hypothetical protein
MYLTLRCAGILSARIDSMICGARKARFSIKLTLRIECPSRVAIREATGQSMMAYVSRWRMVVACRLLTATGLGLSDIAVEVGYTDVAAFSRAFKAIVGVSPAKWRNEKGNADRTRRCGTINSATER